MWATRLFEAVFSLGTLHECLSSSTWGRAYSYLFLVFMYVVMLNLLIAIMSNTFSVVEEASVEAYQLTFAQLVVYWLRHDPNPNPIPHPNPNPNPNPNPSSSCRILTLTLTRHGSPPSATTPCRILRMPYELGLGCCWLGEQCGAAAGVKPEARLAAALEEPVKRWLRRRHGAAPADVKLPSAQFRQLRKGALLEHVLDYYSEHEADQAQAERWRVHLGKDGDRRSKALRAQIEKKVRRG